MKKKQSPSRAREILWIAVAIMSFMAAIHKTYNQDFKSSIQFWIFILIALGMFFIRRNMRKKEEKDLD